MKKKETLAAAAVNDPDFWRKALGGFPESESNKNIEKKVSVEENISIEADSQLSQKEVKATEPERVENAVDTMSFVNAVEQKEFIPVKPRTGSRQKKASFEEYKKLFLETPKIEDRKTVFISGIFRDKLDEVARKLGDRKMSVSGFIENLVRHHLEVYEEDLNAWKKLWLRFINTVDSVQ